MKKAFLWLQQPTSVAGISALFGIVAAGLLRQITWEQSLPLLFGALVSIILPDNSSAKANAIELSASLLQQLGSDNARAATIQRSCS